jgi:hypothetical protein
VLELATHAVDYPTVDDIAYGMGVMLGRFHWDGGYDGRDVEFIMGGTSFSGVAMNVIDFNQVCMLHIWWSVDNSNTNLLSQDASLVKEEE